MAVPDLPPMSGGPPPAPVRRVAHDFDLDSLSPDDLLQLRSEIDQRLPVRALKDLNLQRELVFQLLSTQSLQNSVMRDENVPANQKGQIAGQVASILGTLGKLQIEVYASERLKQVEAVLISVLNTLPMEQQEAFMQGYEAALGAMDG